jgi:hypothetical protein
VHPLACLVSHKCIPASTHERCIWRTTDVGQAVSAALGEARVEALVDPFGPGVAIGSKIDGLPFEALLFIVSRDSLASPWCHDELATARARHIPVFALRTDDVPVPDELAARVVVAAVAPLAPAVHAEIRTLAGTLSARAGSYGALRLLCLGTSAAEQRLAAEWLEHDSDESALGEMLDYVDEVWHAELDPTARCALVRAVGRITSLASTRLLREWRLAMGSIPADAERVAAAAALDELLGRRPR